MNAIVHRLTALQGAPVLSHLLALSPQDRRLRFTGATDDAAIERYVAALDFARDTVFGLCETGDAIIGVAHLALLGKDGAAELGLSVAPDRRGRGYGYALLSIAAAHGAKLGCRRLYLPYMAENRVIIHLARKAGMTVVRQNAEADAHIALEPRRDEHTARRSFSLLEWLAVMRGGWQRSRHA